MRAGHPLQGKEVAYEVIDVPGHPRVRYQAGQYYKTVDKVLFLVDAVDFMAQKSLLAEHLYEVKLSCRFLPSFKFVILWRHSRTQYCSKVTSLAKKACFHLPQVLALVSA